MPTSIYGNSISFDVAEADYSTVKADVLSSLDTLKNNNLIMRVSGRVDEITMPASTYRFAITFDVETANRDTVKNQVVTKLTTLKTAGKISNIAYRIEERLEFSIENVVI